MKLITHNMLQSNVKGVQKGYPLGIKATKLNVLDVPFNKEFVKSMLSRLDYAVLRMAARAVCGTCYNLTFQLGYNDLPEEIPSNGSEDEEFLRKVHHAMNNVCWQLNHF